MCVCAVVRVYVFAFAYMCHTHTHTHKHTHTHTHINIGITVGIESIVSTDLLVLIIYSDGVHVNHECDRLACAHLDQASNPNT